MIIMDLHQVAYAALHASLGKHTNTEIELDLFRHMVLNIIRNNNVKFRLDYGQLVIAVDSINYWRKAAFPYYKASRRKARQESDLDWKAIFHCMDQVKQEIQAHLPYKYVCVDGAEADDIIGTLCLRTEEPTLILSGDRDFIQLHNERVKQFDPVRSKYVRADDPYQYLLEHIIRGDRGDGIPNILSDDNCFVVGARQRKITEKRLPEMIAVTEHVRTNRPFTLDDPRLHRNISRNIQLIDLSRAPAALIESIVNAYQQYDPPSRKGLVTYFGNKRLRAHMSNINDF